MQVMTQLLVIYSILFPTKTWYAPNQPIEVQIRDINTPVTLVLIDFLGKAVEGDVTVQAVAGQTLDLRVNWPQLRTTGTYVLLAVPTGKTPREFIGTPLVIAVRGDRRRDAPPGPMVVKVEPLRYAVISTDVGDMTVAFYYDVAPHTVANFQSLAMGGFYDGLLFHRVETDFIIQSGDPKADGTGGPGYNIDAEFSGREHRPGVLSMARQLDPLEQQGSLPRSDAANSAGSQFFIALNWDRTRQLDGRYTAFGKVVGGMDVVTRIGQAQVEPKTKAPLTPIKINSVKILPVTSENDPYAEILNLSGVPTTQPLVP